MKMHHFLFVIVLLLFTAGCATTVDPTPAPYTLLQPPQLNLGDPIPPPADEVILTIRGRISNSNSGDELQLDMATLEQIGLVEYAVFDEQAAGRTAVFQGVLLSDLMAVAGMDPAATTLRTIALNDYTVDIPRADFANYPVLLATRIDGARMPVADYGPLRIIYPYHSHDFDKAVTDPRWIWQLVVIEVQ